MYKRHRACLLATSLCLVWASQSTPAHGQTESHLSTAREIAKQGLSAFDQGRYAEAADLLERAFQVVQVPTLAVSCARALVKIQKPMKAAEMYMRAINLTPQKDWAAVQFEMQKTAAQEREQLLPRIPRLSIDLQGAKPEEVELEVDGTPLPTALLAAPQMVEPGTREVVGRRGSEEVRVKVELAEGEQKKASLVFGASPAPIPAVPALAPTSEPPTSAPASVAPEPTKDGKLQRTAGYVSLGVGGAGLLFGTVTGIFTMLKDGDLDDGGCRGNECYVDQKSEVDSFNTYRTLSTVGFVVGLVGTAAGATLLLTAPNSTEQGMALHLGPGTAALEGKF